MLRKSGLLFIAALLLLGGESMADTCGPTNVCHDAPYTFTASTGTAIETLYTSVAAPAGNGVELLSIYCTSLTGISTDNVVYIYDTQSSVPYPIAQISIPGAYGTAGSPTINILVSPSAVGIAASAFGTLQTDKNGNPYIQLSPGDLLQASLEYTLTGSNTLTCHAQVVQF